jgi:hypothetical protein
MIADHRAMIVDLKASMLVQDQGYATRDIDRMLRLPVKNEEPDRELLAKLSCAEVQYGPHIDSMATNAPSAEIQDSHKIVAIAN